MRKYLTLFAALVVASAFANAQINEDVWFYQEWRDSKWEDVRKWSVRSNESGLPPAILYESKTESGEYQNDSLKKYDYNGDLLNKTLTLYWNIEESRWDSVEKKSYIYDGDFNLTDIIVELYEIDVWLKYDRFSWTYDEDGDTTEYLNSFWMFETWEPLFQRKYKYDNKKRLSEVLHQLTVDGSTWDNDFHEKWIYDGQDRLISQTMSIWDFALNDWTNWEQFVYSYDFKDRLAQEVYLVWNSPNWSPSDRIQFTYDEDDNIVEKLEQVFSENEWGDYEKLIYRYDEGELFEKTTQIYITDWENMYREILDDPSAILDNANNGAGFSVYPNPASGYFTIDYSLVSPADVEIEIYDSRGRLYSHISKGFQSEGARSLHLDAKNYAAGSYIISIRIGGAVFAEKLIVVD